MAHSTHYFPCLRTTSQTSSGRCRQSLVDPTGTQPARQTVFRDDPIPPHLSPVPLSPGSAGRLQLKSGISRHRRAPSQNHCSGLLFASGANSRFVTMVVIHSSEIYRQGQIRGNNASSTPPVLPAVRQCAGPPHLCDAEILAATPSSRIREVAIRPVPAAHRHFRPATASYPLLRPARRTRITGTKF